MGHSTKTLRDLLVMDIIQKVSIVTGVSKEAILSRSRSKETVMARHMAIYLIRKHKKMKVEDIGALFKRDHSNITYAVSKIKDLMFLDGTIRKMLRHIESDMIVKKGPCNQFPVSSPPFEHPINKHKNEDHISRF